MTRRYLPILAFLFLLVLTIPISSDVATSEVSGWHTTIFPSYFIGGIIGIIILLFLTIGYWLIWQRTDKINWTLFAFHFALTTPTIIYIKFPSVFSGLPILNQEQLMKTIEFRMKLIPIAWAIFISGQFLFLIYFIRTIKTKSALK